ncbi:MAG: hypothetical protein LBK13_03595, partial [Spirochaetales bacterium]|nr:hypothetical protein [Spirochaetales bacterium]
PDRPFYIYKTSIQNLGTFLARPQAAQKPGFPLQVLGIANAIPVGFPLQSHCAAAAQNQAPKLPTAISGAATCQRQLAARNPAVAILSQNCVVCHQACSEAECTHLSPPAVARPAANIRP